MNCGMTSRGLSLGQVLLVGTGVLPLTSTKLTTVLLRHPLFSFLGGAGCSLFFIRELGAVFFCSNYSTGNV